MSILDTIFVLFVLGWGIWHAIAESGAWSAFGWILVITSLLQLVSWKGMLTIYEAEEKR